MTDKSAPIHISAAEGSQGLRKALSQCTGEEVQILLGPGLYYVDETFQLGAQQSNVEIRGQGDVRLIGGKRLHGWKPVTDPSVRKRFDESVRDSVRVIDLRENGVSDYGRLGRRGYSGDMIPVSQERELFTHHGI